HPPPFVPTVKIVDLAMRRTIPLSEWVFPVFKDRDGGMNEVPQHFSPGKPREKATAPVPRPDRRFYAQTQAFGRFGIRWFDPQIMPREHSHGHIELNWLTAGS